MKLPPHSADYYNFTFNQIKMSNNLSHLLRLNARVEKLEQTILSLIATLAVAMIIIAGTIIFR